LHSTTLVCLAQLAELRLQIEGLCARRVQIGQGLAEVVEKLRLVRIVGAAALETAAVVVVARR
jgi:hypothetical protein